MDNATFSIKTNFVAYKNDQSLLTNKKSCLLLTKPPSVFTQFIIMKQIINKCNVTFYRDYMYPSYT